MARADFFTHERARARPPAKRRCSPIRATPPPARCASSTRRSPPAGRCRLFCYALGEVSETVADSHWDFLARLRGWGFKVNDRCAAVPARRRGARLLSRHRRRAAPACPMTSTASSTRSTGSTGRPAWVRSAAVRAGRSPINSRPNRRTHLLREIRISVGRTGALTPYAVLRAGHRRRRRGQPRHLA